MNTRFLLQFLLSLVAQLVAGTLPAIAAGRSCVDNFSQSGQKFQSFIEAAGDPNKALIALARNISSQGFLGMTVSKDVGIVSAYQENSGRKSAVNATVSELAPGKLKVEASFTLATGLRASIAGVREAMCEMLEVTLSTDERNKLASDASNSILLKGVGSDLKLDIKVGQQRRAGFGPVLMIFMDFPGSAAQQRTKDSKPILSVPTKEDPAKSYFIVKLSPYSDSVGGNMRALKIGSAGTLFRAAATGIMDMAPDKDWTLPFATKLEGGGRWSISPLQDLAPGEYGLWDAANGALSSFGVD